LRISEALRLRRADVDLESGIITVRESKCRHLRIVPLHPTASAALRVYAKRRNRHFPGADFFIVSRSGNAIAYSTIRTAFRKLCIERGWDDGSHRPRLHDLRHTFASRVLRRWHNRSGDGEDRIDWLSIYLGHERVSNTYWYLSAVPDLFAASAKRFQYPETI
jgi:integrase